MNAGTAKVAGAQLVENMADIGSADAIDKALEAPRASETETQHYFFVWPLVAFSAAALAVLPFAGLPGPAIPAITPIFATLVFSTEMATAVLLLIVFSARPARSILLLACAYLYSGAMALPHLLTFPGAIIEGEVVLGTPQSAGWVFISWQLGFAVLTLLAIIARIGEAPGGSRPPVPVRAGVAVALTLGGVAAITTLSTAFVDQLPPMMGGGSWLPLNASANVVVVGLLVLGAGLILLRTDRSDRLFRWLVLALVALAFANLLSGFGGGRYSVGWSVGRLSWVVSASVLFSFFLHRFAHQVRELAEARQHLEARVQDRTAKLSAMVSERDMLLREVYHRVNNNLQTISMLLMMERRRLPSSDEGRALERMAHRARAMGFVHQQIMGSERLYDVEMAVFLAALARSLDESLALAERGIALDVTVGDITLGIDAGMTVGMIVNELVSNAAEHAFAEGGPGRVLVALQPAEAGLWTLEVRDEGGAAAGAALAPGLGTRIVGGLVRQIGGTLETTTGAGLSHRITFSPLESAPA